MHLLPSILRLQFSTATKGPIAYTAIQPVLLLRINRFRMPHATQADPSLKDNVASGASDGHSVPFALCIENDNPTRANTVQISEKAIESSAVLQILTNDPCGHLVCYSAKPFSSQFFPVPPTLIAETRYGVKGQA